MGRAPNEPDPSTGPWRCSPPSTAATASWPASPRLSSPPSWCTRPSSSAWSRWPRAPPCRQYVEDTDRILGANGGLINCWLLVSRLHIPKWFGPFIDVEARCTAKREWSCMVVPGLLQTAEYARALGHAGRPNATDEQINHEVDVRMHRQEILRRPDPPLLWTVIHALILLCLVVGWWWIRGG